MPKRAARPCRYPGCARVVLEGVPYCEEHARVIARRHDTDNRPSPSKRGYGRRWRRLRSMYLSQQPLCEDPFGVHGDEPPVATEVDHIVPRSAGGTDAWENLQALCKSCHSRKTASEDGRWG